METIIKKLDLSKLNLENPEEWEYYMKRKNRYYFRQFGRKMSFDLNNTTESDKLKYGNHILQIELPKQ